MLENKSLVKKIPIFAVLTPDEIEQIEKIILTNKYEKGNILFFEGEAGEAVFFIKKGKIKIYKSDFDGREYILNIFGDGDMFAEAVLLEGGPYPATAEAVEDSIVGMIKNVDLENILMKNSRLMVKIVKVLSHRLRETQEKLKNMVFKDTYDRTSCMLHSLSVEHGVKTSRGIEFKLLITRQELASLVGTSRETVTRVMSDLKKEGIIDINRQNITVLNERRLMRCMKE